MKLDFRDPFDVKRGNKYYEKLLRGNKKVELTEKKPAKSIKLNAYLHVVITLSAIYHGYTIEERKVGLKRSCHFMRYERKGGLFLKQTSKMLDKEVSEFIEWIRTSEGKEGNYIPTSEEYLQNKFSIDKEIDKVKEFL